MYQSYPYRSGKARLKGDFASLPPFLLENHKTVRSQQRVPAFSRRQYRRWRNGSCYCPSDGGCWIWPHGSMCHCKTLTMDIQIFTAQQCFLSFTILYISISTIFRNPWDSIYISSDMLGEVTKSDSGPPGSSRSIESKTSGSIEIRRNELLPDVRTDNSLKTIDSSKEIIYRMRKIYLPCLEVLKSSLS